MALAHELARDDAADAACRGRTCRYHIALRDALTSAWITAQGQRWCHQRDAAFDALPSRAAILVERTAALMIDSGPRMVAELAAMDARAAAMGIRL